MEMTYTKCILEYLTDLAQNNNREWYHANKERYKQANAEFERLVGVKCITRNNIFYTFALLFIPKYSSNAVAPPPMIKANKHFIMT